ncbi:MAG TPA: transposase [Syntrophomonadaceae bacterium]|nr:transposase [Syntrophomonadaceae bacterium]
MGRMQRVYGNTGCYHIMLRGNRRKKIFHDYKDREKFLTILADNKDKVRFSIYSFCLMDNHIHMVIRDQNNTISKIMRGIATSYAMFFNYKYGWVGHVFQDRFKSEPIEDDRYLLGVIRYIHGNPVKAGIVHRPEQYFWSSYRFYLDSVTAGSNLVDSGFVLDMLSDDRAKALEEFVYFSAMIDEFDYMDDEGKVINLTEVQAYLDQYLDQNWTGVDKNELINDALIRKTIINELRSKTQLSDRKIAELLGISRYKVRSIDGNRRECLLPK